jgi:hypothetical protein
MHRENPPKTVPKFYQRVVGGGGVVVSTQKQVKLSENFRKGERTNRTLFLHQKRTDHPLPFHGCNIVYFIYILQV